MFHGSEWYGNWQIVIVSIVLATFIYTLFFAKPKKIDWKSFGLTEAFIISLFTEMFGVPLTIYLLSSYFGIDILLNRLTGHLWATALAYLGLVDLSTGVFIVMVLSLIIIFFGLILLIGGWYQVYNKREDIATDGLYGLVRHPQYLGIMMIIVGFIVQWPTLPTLIMFPFLIYIYFYQAIKEEKYMVHRFESRYIEYLNKVPRFNIFKGIFNQFNKR